MQSHLAGRGESHHWWTVLAVHMVVRGKLTYKVITLPHFYQPQENLSGAVGNHPSLAFMFRDIASPTE